MDFFDLIESLCEDYECEFVKLNPDKVMVNNAVIRDNGEVYLRNDKECIVLNNYRDCNEGYNCLKGVTYKNVKFSKKYTKKQEIALSFVLNVLEKKIRFPEIKDYTIGQLEEEICKEGKILQTRLKDSHWKFYTHGKKDYFKNQTYDEEKKRDYYKNFMENLIVMNNLLEDENVKVTHVKQFYSLLFHDKNLNFENEEMETVNNYFKKSEYGGPFATIVYLSFNNMYSSLDSSKFKDVEKVYFVYDIYGNGMPVHVTPNEYQVDIAEKLFLNTLKK